MVAPNLLVVKHKSSPSQLASLAGGTTPTQLGGNVTSDEAPSGGDFWGTNRAVWFKGTYFVLCMESSVWTVRAYDSIGGALVNNTGLAQSAGAGSQSIGCSGLFVTKSSSPIMFAYIHGPSQIFLVTTTDGRTWTSTNMGTTSSGGMGRGLLYRNQLYIPMNIQNGQGFAIVDPVGLTATVFNFSTTAFPPTGSCLGSLCVFRNRLYYLRTSTVSGAVNLYEFTGGAFVVRQTVSAIGGNNSAASSADHFLFPVGSTKMVGLCFFDTGNASATAGSSAFDFVPLTATTFTMTPKTSTLIPTSLRRTADGGSGTGVHTQRWTGFVDNDFNATPGSPAVVVWLLTNENGGTYSYYEYVNSDTELGPGSASVSAGYALPYDSRGGGDRTYSAGVLKGLVTNVGPSPTLGKMRISVTLWGDIEPSNTSTNASRPGTLFAGRRPAVVAATTGALPAVTYANGAAGAGATLTRVGNGALPLQDNVSLTSLQRLLVKNQASALENGIYEVTSLGDGSNPFILTRVTDFDTFLISRVYPTAWVYVTLGSTLTNTAWYFRAANPDLTIGTTAITWVQMPAFLRFFRLWYSVNETPNMVQTTLAGTPMQADNNGNTYGALNAPVVTRNVSVLENVNADGATVYTFDWDAQSDALQIGQPVHLMARVGAS